jgi:glycosyltransferase involved in cell wall biosynthesis
MVNRFGKAFFKILRDHKINIVVLTEFHKRFLANSGVSSKLVTVFPNYLSIELDNFNTQKKKEKYFIYAGRISKEKGVEELITAFLSCELKKTNLYILGNGPNLNYLENKYKNKNIFFKNQLSNEESIDCIKNAACVVTATKLHEGQPTLLCEASMMKVPSIFPQNGGISEFFPPNYKLSFKQFDYEDLINVFMNLSNYNLEQIGEENYQFFKNSINEDKLTKLIDSLIEKVKK